jgi:hypothetical protein
MRQLLILVLLVASFLSADISEARVFKLEVTFPDNEIKTYQTVSELNLLKGLPWVCGHALDEEQKSEGFTYQRANLQCDIDGTMALTVNMCSTDLLRSSVLILKKGKRSYKFRMFCE